MAKLVWHFVLANGLFWTSMHGEFFLKTRFNRKLFVALDLISRGPKA
jgi:hypothetical protein